MAERTRTAVLWAVIYARVSGEEQAKKGYSLRQQIEALRAWCEAEGYEVLEEVTDPGHSGAYLERPGLDRVRDLAEAGGVSVVVAQDADRITRDPIHRALLDEEMERFGTRLVALDDWGDNSHEGELLRYMKGWVSKGERLKTAERTRRGLNRKVAEGKVVRGNRAPYGFAFDERGEALAVSEPEMGVVRRIFRMVGAEGSSLGEVERRLIREGVPSPSGGLWHRPTIRYLVLNELYRPLTPDEVAASGLVPPEAARGLDEEGVYGLWTWNKKQVKRWRERGEDGGYRDRVRNEARPRDQWSAVAVDLSEAGLVRGQVDAARERLGQNERRPPSTRAKRFWQISGGIARCEVCGNGFSPHTVHQGGKVRAYYRCYTRYNSGLRDCTNRRSMRAPELEEAVWEAVYGLISDPEKLLRQYREHVERKKRRMRGDPDREARLLAEQLRKLEEERRGYLRQNARGVLSDGELDAMLAELDERRGGLQEALREAQARRHALRQPEINYAHLDSLLLQLNGMDLCMASPEDRRRLYQALRLRASVDGEGQVRLSGVFDPDVYLPSVLKNPPDWLTPRPGVAGTRGVVTSDNSRPCTS